MADHCPRWMWRSPGDIIERLLERSAADERRTVPRETMPAPAAVQTCARDRYYTQARRLYIRNLVKIIRGR